ncbi:hypothetical protein SOD_p00050 (plasmid) [Serratia plymuthica 4Rx13]|uniref:Uncharacterized protein n=1 Tax=Serratia plymuthica TaxID=82996 RepID=A0A318NS33_SERPL|nr:hypothetical protein [Serratia plymuthica]AGO57679.1 hypothetical protein SOD_p00050 [Serratia plymuthica 4Rx13]PYD36554.1 hypothetical protein CT690_23705 [Serratia plymuthica]
MNNESKNTIKALKLSILLNGDYQLKKDENKRPPLGRYNASLGKTLNYLKKVIENNNLIHDTKIYLSNQPNYDGLIDALINFMHSYMAHVETLCGIVVDFYGDDKKITKIKREINKLDSRIYLATIINYIKHSDGSLRTASITGVNNDFVMGFYVEGYSDNAIGPSREVHKHGDDVISINYFIRKVIADIFIVDNFISSNLEQFITTKEEINIDDELFKILTKANELPLKFFDMEFKRKNLLFFMKKGEVKLEHLKFKREMIISGRMSVNFVGDGVTKTFKLPLGAAN